MELIILKWLIIILAVFNNAFMLYDGTRALINRDYLRTRSGKYARQLGPWNILFRKIGIDPLSTFAKLIFVLFGAAGLIITTAFILDAPWSWKALVIFNICSLWNLFFGTASSIVQIILLVVLRFFIVMI